MNTATAEPRVCVRLPEWTTLAPGAEGQAASVAGRSFDGWKDARRVSEQLATKGILSLTERRDGIGIQTYSFIGRLAVGPLDITIVPKIGWSRWLRLVTFALDLRGLDRSPDVTTHTATDSLIDLIALQLIHEADDLLRFGLHREYRRLDRNLASPRGRIQFATLARQGGIRAPALPCRFSRRHDDNVLNRAVLAGLRACFRWSEQPTVRQLAGQLASDWQRSVSVVPLDLRLLQGARATIDRRTGRYEPALTLIELLLAGCGVSLDQNNRAEVLPGFAIDMNAIWQRILGRVFRQWAPEFNVIEEHRLKDAVRSNSQFPLRRSPPQPRPDYAVVHNDGRATYLDAKYRDLWNTSLPREMFYQLALYAVSQGAGTAAILYPTSSLEAVEERMDVYDQRSRSVRASVSLRPIDLPELETLIDKPQSERDHTRRRLFATRLLGEQLHWHR